MDTQKLKFRIVYIAALSTILWIGWQLSFPTPVIANRPAKQLGILVHLEPGIQHNALQSILHNINGSVEWIEPLGVARIYPANIGVSRATVNVLQEEVEFLERQPGVQYAELDGVVYGVPLEMESRAPMTTIPASPLNPVQINDPDFNNRDRVYAPWLLNTPIAWNYTMGDPEIIIAVVDSGVAVDHPDLRDRVLENGYDFVDDDQNPLDLHGHGTHVAGIIAATANNGLGSAGICPACSILPIRVLDQYNVGTWFDVAAGIVYAVDHGARVINLSLGGSAMPQVMGEAIRYAVEHDVLIVAAAGNGRSDTPFYPAADPNVVAVGATRDDDSLWSLSNYGTWIELTAPGFAIYSTYNELNNYYSGYNFMSGTSMAAPHVSGLAGLLLSQNPDRTPDELRELMRNTAVDLGDPGPDNRFGYGRIDAAKALEAGNPTLTTSNHGALTGYIRIADDLQDHISIEQTQVHIFSPQHQKTIVIKPILGTGKWEATSLSPDQYTVSVMIDAEELSTLVQPDSYVVDIASGEKVDNLDFFVKKKIKSSGSFMAYIPQVQK